MRCLALAILAHKQAATRGFEACIARLSSEHSNRTRRSQLARWLALCSASGCAVLLTVSCGSAVGRGTALYHQQSYVEAAEAFERTEDRLAAMQPVERAQYGLYRGLTFMALGDLRSAERWLDYAQSQQGARPQLLSPGERDLLELGRRTLTQRIRDAWPKPKPSWAQTVATSTHETTVDTEAQTGEVAR